MKQAIEDVEAEIQQNRVRVLRLYVGSAHQVNRHAKSIAERFAIPSFIEINGHDFAEVEMFRSELAKATITFAPMVILYSADALPMDIQDSIVDRLIELGFNSDRKMPMLIMTAESTSKISPRVQARCYSPMRVVLHSAKRSTKGELQDVASE